MLGLVTLQVDVLLWEVEGWGVDAVEDDSREELLVDGVGLERFGEVVEVDKADEDFQEFYHHSVGEDFQYLGVD